MKHTSAQSLQGQGGWSAFSLTLAPSWLRTAPRQLTPGSSDLDHVQPKVTKKIPWERVAVEALGTRSNVGSDDPN